MSAIDRSLDAVAFVSDHFRDILRRRLAELAGLALITLALLAAIALATWSVQDPSLSHATTAPVHNLLGTAGAIVSDLLMQLFGLAAVVLLLPVALIGWRLLAHREFGAKWRHLCWLPAALLAAAFASCLPRSAAWPLPSELGGVFGDALVRGPGFLLGGRLHGFELVIAAVALGLSALTVLMLATGWHWPDRTERASARRVEPRFEEEDIDADGDAGSPWFGAITHTLLSAKARIGRWLRRAPRPAARAAMTPARGPRREPRLDSGELRNSPALADEFEIDEETTAAPRRRVATRAVRRSTNGYQLPALSLLAQPRSIERQTLSNDVIQANATALESVLGDFGVRGEIINARPGPVVTLYELEPAPGIKSSRVIGLADDIARSMSAVSARVAVVSGRNAIGIELPNPSREKVYLRELLDDDDYNEANAKLPLCLGKTIGGETDHRRSRAHAASADRRHHRLRQIGRHQHHDPVACSTG